MQGTAHWLDQYRGNTFEWQKHESNGITSFSRPLGLVEHFFDCDGRYYEGRADINAQLDLEVFTRLTKNQLEERIILAWTILRCEKPILLARALLQENGATANNSTATSNVRLHVEVPQNARAAVGEASEHAVFLADHYHSVDADDFWFHAQNTARVLDASKALAKLFVLPSNELKDSGGGSLRFLMVFAHQIADGLTNYSCMRAFIRLLNMPLQELRGQVSTASKLEGIRQHLPLPQEAHYPRVSGSTARQRWFWAITRILRSVRKPLPEAFPNPLRRKEARGIVSLSPVYDKVLDYSRPPMINTLVCRTHMPPSHLQRLQTLCKQVKATVGAGCWALVAIVMMEIYERNEPDIPLEERKPFVSGFPLNPRPFLEGHIELDSLMLAFCDGIVLPFLPSYLDFDSRLRLLARQAQRQLAAYQKRARPKDEEAQLQYMSSRGAGRIIANQYVGSLERADAVLPHHLRKGIDLQGEYRLPISYGQTNGISSIGRRDGLISSGEYDLEDASKDFVADYRGLEMAVRARTGEFLVAISGGEDGLRAAPSIDIGVMDPVLVDEWKRRMESILEVGQQEAPRAKL